MHYIYTLYSAFLITHKLRSLLMLLDEATEKHTTQSSPPNPIISEKEINLMLARPLIMISMLQCFWETEPRTEILLPLFEIAE